MKGRTAPPLSYRLCLWLERPARLRIGALGEHHLAPGRYVYTGSARRHPRARLERHLGLRPRRLRWHVDYLLTHADCQVVDVDLIAMEECALNARQGGRIAIPGFGASDCQGGCGAHLRYLGAGVAPLAGG